ncbi:fimbria/pilus outer membrane usher protein [Corallococcus macrosporus]|uniref:O-succinylbenzoate--CoA ligase n=1 Tax=Corallococcus macrosporus DSM 14697 TaxID=1189310 RepID=A0A250JXJ8_9BACT|nr:fimbria/pilus outer membrane usher protein [Corallococcus macrosporus]ATB48192.1 o-succinylbenzoate--CoA ligase [Corallococcus macrosporus DSM 14697]
MSPIRPSRPHVPVRTALALSLTVGGLSAAAKPAAPLMPIVADFTLNGVPRGATFPMLRDGDVLLPAAALEAHGVDLESLGGTQEVIEGKTYISARSLEPLGHCVMDERTVSLTCELPAAVFAQTRINLGARAPADYQVRGSPSGFINYAAHARNTSLTFFGEAGASVGRGLLTTQARWRPGAVPLRGLTQLSLDFPKQMVRAIAGEATGFGGVLGGGAVVAGLHLMRTFELNPYFVRNPMQDYAGDVATPSTLEVYVNNHLVQRSDLPPGPFRLENLTVPRGEGNTRYVIRDAFGRTSEVNTAYYLSGQQLSPGVVDFRLSAGVERESVNLYNFDFGRPMLLGNARMGVTSWLTPGVRLELTPNVLSTGALQLIQLPFGELELSQAISRSERRTGLAAGIVYSLQRRWLGGSVFGRGMNEHYTHTSLKLDDDHPIVETGGSLFLALGESVSVGGQAMLSRYQQAGWTTWLGATTSARLTDWSTLSFAANRSRSERGETAVEGMVYLNAIFDSRTTGTLGHSQGLRGGEGTTSVDIARSVPMEGGLGYQVQGRVGAVDQAMARADYDSQVGRVSAGAEWFQGRLAGMAEVAGGLVMIGGRIRPTRAVDQGYALVRVRGVEGVGVRLNNHEIGRTDAHGELVVTRLQAYNANRLSLADHQVPLDIYLPSTEQTVATYQRGGVVLDFKAQTIRAYRGKVTIDSAEDTRWLSYGELRVEKDGEQWSSPIGWNGEFELVGLPEGRLPATVVYPKGRCATSLEVPSVEGKVVDLGTVRCVHDTAK